jgi:hypothetical protein
LLLDSSKLSLLIGALIVIGFAGDGFAGVGAVIVCVTIVGC